VVMLSLQSELQAVVILSRLCRCHCKTQYELITDHTATRLVLRYQSFTPAGKMSWKTLASNKSILSYQICQSVGATPRSVRISDLYLKVQRKNDDEYERDVSCDSDFMKDNMVQVGQAMREKFQWVDASTPLYLVMDNAGGHGKNDIIEAYRADLWNKFKVKIVHQIPRSPETNLLDLGLWCSLQNHVEKEHRFKTRSNKDALAHSIKAVWESWDASILQKVYDRWVKVLDLIIMDGGNNKMLNSH